MFDYRDFEITHGMLRYSRDRQVTQWAEIAPLAAPHSGQFLDFPRDMPPEYSQIVDDTMLRAAATLRAGFMMMRTNPSRPWFALRTPDPSLNKRASVKKWMWQTRELMRQIHSKSNTYEMFSHHYGEDSNFGTAASITVDRPDTLFHHHNLTVGEYFVGVNEYDEPDTLVREFTMTAANMVREFGIENVTPDVASAFRNKHYMQTFKVLHVIAPRSWAERAGKVGQRGMRFVSAYVDMQDKTTMRESGFEDFPAIVSRWEARPGSPWGVNYPGIQALGSIKRLQIEQYRKAEGIDYQTKPPVQIPNALRDRDADLLPGGQIPFDQTNPYGGVRTAFEVPLRLDHLLADIEDVRRSIRATYHVPLIQTMASLSDTTQRTAYEVRVRRDEAAIVLGPVTLQLQRSLDIPLITSTFFKMVRAGMVPPAPPELQGQPLEIEMTGPLAQALKSAEAAQIDQFVAQVAMITQFKPDVADKFDPDSWADAYSDMLGVSPDLIVANEDVAVIRQARAESMRAQAEAENAEQVGRTARDLALAQTERPSALTALAQQGGS